MKFWAAVFSLLLLTGTLPLTAQTAPNKGTLAAKLQPFVDDGSMAGAVLLVGSKDKILDLETVGYSDLAARSTPKAKPRPTSSRWNGGLRTAVHQEAAGASAACPANASPTWKRVKRRMTMFSPSSAIFAASRSLIVFVLSFTKACSSRQTVL